MAGLCHHRLVPLDASAVARKLKLGAATRPAILGGTDGDRAALAVARGMPIPDDLDGEHDWILLYVENRAALTRDQGWDALREADLMWLSLVSIDETWSAFSLRRYKPGEARQTFR
jgi:hypothetical protein